MLSQKDLFLNIINKRLRNFPYSLLKVIFLVYIIYKKDSEKMREQGSAFAEHKEGS